PILQKTQTDRWSSGLARELVEYILLDAPEQASGDVRASELRAAVPNAIKESLDRGEGTFNQRLGSQLRDLIGRRFGVAEFQIERAKDDKHSKVAQWRIRAKGDVDRAQE
ncbi:MAG TPA: hypothetical protein VHP11_01900, partial [Tepidisphaeraceae bacterium]|nr:hypothetical protein [Tepidisphaeraceae bacterium]